MKLEKLITNLHAGDKTYTRAIVRDSFKKEGDVVEFIKVYKVAPNVRFPDGEFVPLFDNLGRIADFAK
jgi:hypothetical protein